MKRVAFAFVVSPILVMTILATASAFWIPKDGDSLAFILLIMGIPIAYLSGLVVGIPTLAMFARRNWLSIWHLMLIGACAGIPYSSLFFFQPMPRGMLGAASICLTLCAIGSITTGVFWLIGIRGNKRIHAIATPCLRASA